MPRLRGERLRSEQSATGKTPSPNLLLILITNGERRRCLRRFLCDAGMGDEAGSAGATGRLQMSLKHSQSCGRVSSCLPGSLPAGGERLEMGVREAFVL